MFPHSTPTLTTLTYKADLPMHVSLSSLACLAMLLSTITVDAVPEIDQGTCTSDRCASSNLLTNPLTVATLSNKMNHSSDLPLLVHLEFQKVTCGSSVKLTHIKSQFKLHSHQIPYGTGSGQQSITAVPGKDDTNSLWQGTKNCNNPLRLP